jgi:glycosyltransferase involved in cell wall biosynthesis
MKLSIIIPTLNRLESLKRCLSSIEYYKPKVEHEIIVIDGGSTDGTKEFLFEQSGIILIEHNARLGCIKAFNDGFRISRGEYCAQLSDDVYLRDNSLHIACMLLDNCPDLGQVVIRHLQGNRLQWPQFQNQKGDRFLIMPFGLTRRCLGDTVGWWGDYYHQQGDIELSLKVYNAGYKIEALPDRYYVLHEPGESELRTHIPDAKLFAERWANWTL